MNKELKIIREFDAPIEMVFDAFATAEAMAEWWGPAGSKITVVTYEFKPGGLFHYKMESPQMIMWGRFIFKNIKRPELIEFINSFSNENAEIASAPFEGLNWPLEVYNRLSLEEKNGKTTLILQGSPINASETELKTFQDMRENVTGGFNATLNQLDAYLKAQFQLRKENKTITAARTSTYLNFAGNTEEAFDFYRSVFKTEFHGRGIQRFGDIPPQENQPPMTEQLKKMILHIELPILGGHILMGTDAPAEMGFNLSFGNNSHICLEPDNRAEAKRLFDELSVEGKITMPLEDTFWGAYYGSFTDKFGVNWMINCVSAK